MLACGVLIRCQARKMQQEIAIGGRRRRFLPQKTANSSRRLPSITHVTISCQAWFQRHHLMLTAVNRGDLRKMFCWLKNDDAVILVLSIPSVRRRLRGLSLNVHCGGFNDISCSSASKSSAIIYKSLGPYQGRTDPANQETKGKRRTLNNRKASQHLQRTDEDSASLSRGESQSLKHLNFHCHSKPFICAGKFSASKLEIVQ